VPAFAGVPAVAGVLVVACVGAVAGRATVARVPAVACACRLLLACLLLLRPVAKGVTAVSGLSAPCSYPAAAGVLSTFIAGVGAKTNVPVEVVSAFAVSALVRDLAVGFC